MSRAVNNKGATVEPMTREENAEFHGVSPACIDWWTRRGMPTVENGGGPGTGDDLQNRPPRDWRVTRRELATLLKVHQDTISRKLADGLAAAVVKRGRHGEAMVFDLRLAYRWWLASEGQLNDRARRLRGVLGGWPARAVAVVARRHPHARTGTETGTAGTEADRAMSLLRRFLVWRRPPQPAPRPEWHWLRDEWGHPTIGIANVDREELSRLPRRPRPPEPGWIDAEKARGWLR